MTVAAIIGGQPPIVAAYADYFLEPFGHFQFTKTGVNLGAAHANRVIYCGWTFTTNQLRTVNQFTLAGVNGQFVAGDVVQEAPLFGQYLYAAIYRFPIPTGTSGTCYFNLSGISGTQNGFSFVFYRTVAPGSEEVAADGAPGTGLTLNVPGAPGTFLIYCGVANGSPSGFSLSGFTPDYNQVENDSRHLGGGVHRTTGGNIALPFSAPGATAIAAAACVVGP